MGEGTSIGRRTTSYRRRLGGYGRGQEGIGPKRVRQTRINLLTPFVSSSEFSPMRAGWLIRVRISFVPTIYKYMSILHVDGSAAGTCYDNCIRPQYALHVVERVLETGEFIFWRALFLQDRRPMDISKLFCLSVLQTDHPGFSAKLSSHNKIRCTVGDGMRALMCTGIARGAVH